MGRYKAPTETRANSARAEFASETKRVKAKGPPRQPANRKKLSDRNVLTLPVKKGKQYLVWDTGTDAAGGAVLVNPTGRKTFLAVYYKLGRKSPNYMKVGRVGEMTVAEFREKCRDIRKKAAQGLDPKADKPIRTDTFKVAVEDYIARYQIGQKERRSAEGTKALILSACKQWHDTPVGTLTKQEIKRHLEHVRDGNKKDGIRPKRYLANRLYAHLRHFFKWQVGEDVLTVSPMLNIEKPWGEAKSRERSWFKGEQADAFIKSLWSAASKIGGEGGRFIKILLVTGKRRNAVASMQWQDIDRDWLWTPPAGSKNKRNSPVPLPKLVQHILHPRQASGPVFPGLGDVRVLERRVIELTGCEDFFWHGLRHVAETKCAELRDEKRRSLIQPHIRDLLFDHAVQRGSGRGYDHYDYLLELEAAVEVWGKHIEGLVVGAGVTVAR